eukprot:1088299-Rhodomonas_salina.1
MCEVRDIRDPHLEIAVKRSDSLVQTGCKIMCHLLVSRISNPVDGLPQQCRAQRLCRIYGLECPGETLVTMEHVVQHRKQQSLIVLDSLLRKAIRDCMLNYRQRAS